LQLIRGKACSPKLFSELIALRAFGLYRGGKPHYPNGFEADKKITEYILSKISYRKDVTLPDNDDDYVFGDHYDILEIDLYVLYTKY